MFSICTITTEPNVLQLQKGNASNAKPPFTKPPLRTINIIIIIMIVFAITIICARMDNNNNNNNKHNHNNDDDTNNDNIMKGDKLLTLT